MRASRHAIDLAYSSSLPPAEDYQYQFSLIFRSEIFRPHSRLVGGEDGGRLRGVHAQEDAHREHQRQRQQERPPQQQPTLEQPPRPAPTRTH
jgi:hypothetical protein